MNESPLELFRECVVAARVLTRYFGNRSEDARSELLVQQRRLWGLMSAKQREEARSLASWPTPEEQACIRRMLERIDRRLAAREGMIERNREAFECSDKVFDAEVASIRQEMYRLERSVVRGITESMDSHDHIGLADVAERLDAPPPYLNGRVKAYKLACTTHGVIQEIVREEIAACKNEMLSVDGLGAR